MEKSFQNSPHVGETVTVHFRFPDDSQETFTTIEMPVVPRIGETIREEAPDSKPYKVANVEFGLSGSERVCTRITVTLAHSVGH